MSVLEDGESPVTRPQSRQLGHLLYQTVAQGADTDCYGELIDSILGAYFGPGHLEERWLAPFNDEIRAGASLLLRAVAVSGGETDGRAAKAGCGGGRPDPVALIGFCVEVEYYYAQVPDHPSNMSRGDMNREERN